MIYDSPDYQAGYEEGVEVGKTICESEFKNRSCRNCGWIDEFDGCNLGNYSYDVPDIIEFSGCGKWEKKQ